MATITVRVPIKGSEKERLGFVCNVSAHIDAGNSVQFVDDLDGTTEVNLHRLQCASAATVNHRARGYADNQSQAIYYEAGGWHDVPVGISKILAADTSTGKGIHVAIG
jgi:hypothetical protein